MVDLQGRLIGKRFHANSSSMAATKKPTRCNYLARRRHRNGTCAGLQGTSWQKGYGDFVLKPDMSTLRRTPWLAGTALVLCDVLDHHTHSPIAACAARYPEEAVERASKPEDESLYGLRA